MQNTSFDNYLIHTSSRPFYIVYWQLTDLGESSEPAGPRIKYQFRRFSLNPVTEYVCPIYARLAAAATAFVSGISTLGLPLFISQCTT